MSMKGVRTAHVRASDQRQGVFEAHAVTYMSEPDSYGTLWAPGCFTVSLNRRLPTIQWGHDWQQLPLGRAISWTDTSIGPLVTSRLDVAVNPLAAQAAAQIEAGTIDSVSVGFSAARRRAPTAEERKRWPDAREVVIEASLDELSLVPKGSVPGALVTSIRAATGMRVENERLRLGRMLAKGAITQQQYAAWVAAERAADEALDVVARKQIRAVGDAISRLGRSPGASSADIQRGVAVLRHLGTSSRNRGRW